MYNKLKSILNFIVSIIFVYKFKYAIDINNNFSILNLLKKKV